MQCNSYAAGKKIRNIRMCNPFRMQTFLEVFPCTVLATAKLSSFPFLLKNEDAYFGEQRRIFQRTKTHKNEDATKKCKKAKNRKKNENATKKTHKNEDAKERIYIGALYTSLQIINSSFEKNV